MYVYVRVRVQPSLAEPPTETGFDLDARLKAPQTLNTARRVNMVLHRSEQCPAGSAHMC